VVYLKKKKTDIIINCEKIYKNERARRAAE
jgi:hypothetical protein